MSTETPNPQPGDMVRFDLTGRVRAVDGHHVKVQGNHETVTLNLLDAAPVVLERADDPSREKVGTQRQQGGRLAVLSDADTVNDPWALVVGNVPGEKWRLSHKDVVGWTVIGVAPGTPAAEQTPVAAEQAQHERFAATVMDQVFGDGGLERGPQVRVENAPSLPIPVRQQAADRLVAGDVPGAVAAVVSGGFTRDQAERYVRDMEEWQTYLNHHGQGERVPRVFRSDGPEPPDDVKVLEWLKAPAIADSPRYVHRVGQGWLWSTSPVGREPNIPATPNSWVGAVGGNHGRYREVV